MHRIDTPTAQKDKFGSGKNGFTRGNPQTGVQATQLDDDYCDSIQEEIAGVIEGVGIALQKGNKKQLLAAINKTTTGRLLNVQKFTSSGTYTPSTGTKSILVEVQAGGGGGGNATGTASLSSFGTSGGAGGYASSYLPLTAGVASVVVGSGGVAAVNGGLSSFSGYGHTITSQGGKGGGNGVGTGGLSSNVHARGAEGGTSSGGNIVNSNGGAGTPSFILSGTPSGGVGGNSYFSGGALGAGATGGAGAPGLFGAGGSGATVFTAATSFGGGKGGDGIVIILEYA